MQTQICKVMAWTRIAHTDGQTDRQTDRVHDTYSYGDISMCQLQDGYGKDQRNNGPDTNSCYKTYNFDPEIKIQGHTEIMNIRNTIFEIKR